MSSILNNLLFRLKKSKSFYILMGICVFLPAFSAILFKLAVDAASVYELGQDFHITLPALADIISISGDVLILILIEVSIFLGREFSDGTIRNTLLTNKKRIHVYLSYFIIGMLIALIYLITYMVSTLLIMGLSFGFGGFSVSKIVSCVVYILLLGILSSTFVVSCVTFFVMITGKQSLSIVYPLLICLILPGLLSSVLGIVEVVNEVSTGISTDYSWVPFVNTMYFQFENVKFEIVAKISMYYIIFSLLFCSFGCYITMHKDYK